MAYERPRIISVIGRTIKIAHQEQPPQPKTTQTVASTATATTTTVLDNTGFADDDFIILGKLGAEQTEIVRINAAVTRGTSLTHTATVFNHAIGSDVQKLQFNQWRIYGNSSNTITGATLIDTVDVRSDAPFTTYVNTGTEYAFYFARGYDSNAASDSDQESDGVQRAASLTGYSPISVGSIIEKSLRAAKVDFMPFDFLIEEVNDCLRFVAGRLKRWAHLQSFDYVFSQATRGVYSFTLPTDIEDNDSNKSILGIRVGANRNLTYKDKREWEVLLEDANRTQIRTAGSAHDVTLAVDNSYDFNDSGSLGNGLAGYWKFDENTGTTAFDSSGNANDGTITGATYVTGNSDQALDFDGTNDIVTVTDDSAIQNIFDSGGAVSFWINADSDGENDLGRILDKVWDIHVAGESGGNIEIVIEVPFSVTNGIWSTAVNIPINTWTHVAIVYDNDSTANNPIIYINGSSVTVTEDQTPSGTRTTDAGTDLNIGNNAATTRTFDGTIDEVRLYNRFLVEEETDILHANPGGGDHSVHIFINNVLHVINYTDISPSATAGILLGVPYSGTGSIVTALAVDTNVWQDETEGKPKYFTVYDGSLYIWPLPDASNDNANVYLDYHTNRTLVNSAGDTIEFERYDAVKHWLTWKIRSHETNPAGKLDLTDPDYLLFQDILLQMVRREVSGQKFKQIPKYNAITY